MSDDEYESLYLYFFELDTDELLNAGQDLDLDAETSSVLADVLEDRRAEITSMIDMLEEELCQRKKSKRIVKIPEEIMKKIQESAAA
jgi:hypothetical protein